MANISLTSPLQGALVKSPLPRVLYVLNMNPSHKFGSMEEQIVFLSRAFEKEGSHFTPLFTLAQKPGDTDCLGDHGVRALRLDLMRFRLGSLIALWNLVGKLGIDIIHWNMTNPLKNEYLWALTCLRPRVRHFYTDHNSRDLDPYQGPRGWKKSIKRLLLKRYEKVLCVSQFVRESLEAQDTWSHLVCCRHFINTNRFRPDGSVRADMRLKYNVNDRFVATVIAQLIRAKGIDLVLRALQGLPEKVVLWIVGTGPQAEELANMARQLGVDKRVAFWGMQRNVEPFLQASDCFVLPSRWREAAGLVVLEAQAVGLPVVASRIGGIPEYIEEGRTGLLFASENVDQLEAHIKTLCEDISLRDRMGIAARELAHDRFSSEICLPRVLDCYRQG